MGVFINGYFIMAQSMKSRKDASKLDWCIIVAVGQDTYRVWLKDRTEYDLSGISVGSEIMIKARPYVGNNGSLRWTAGEIVE